MSGTKPEASAHEREIGQVSTTQDTSREDRTTKQKRVRNEVDPDGPGLRSTLRDPSTMNGRFRWD